VDVFLWWAACRLAGLVGALLAIIGPQTVHDALLHRGSSFAQGCAALSALFSVVACLVLVRVRPFFVGAEADAASASPIAAAYRENARPTRDHAREARLARATRDTAGALSAFMAACALILVAAACR
jgi:hypothetical protein